MGEIAGRVVITWPAASTPPTALAALCVRINDAETNEPMLDVVALELKIGSPAEGWSDHVIEVDLTRLATADGQPIGGGPGSANRLALTDEYAAYREELQLSKPHPIGQHPEGTFDGPKFRTVTLRYVVAEMGLALTQPGVQPPVAVGVRMNESSDG